MFYPSHDIALGNGVKHFNPPAAALRLQEDLAWLADIFGPQPWGWSWDMRQYMHQQRHIPLADLPTDADLEGLRQLSSRRTTIQILEALNYQDEMPEYLDTEEAIDRYIGHHDQTGTEFVLKTPWSSSGRGLIRSSVTPRPVMRQRALTTLHKMGGVMGERWQHKLQDFAMLFYVGSHEVRFMGYSLFDNEESGTYRQGYLRTNADIEHALEQQANQPAETLLHPISAALTKILTTLFAPFMGKAWEVGYIGIDMMLYQTSDRQIGLMPCVEMNVRCTMGIVCRLWSDQHLREGETGRFVISPMGSDGHFVAEFIMDK